ncbi:hypothetical protein BOX15_Mlig033731g3 [Macrostomum lignano]|uniref:Uncharacterized protein n=2 Tax=Macrostomum lignano TaxID=282301 RepID=A0A267FZZ2_9PLAT|nr:hypothetical protein BOX15_Mlig033731g3 [Macrostomum lignano]
MADPNAVLADIGVFKREQMNHVEVAEKVVLPDREQVESEKREASLRQEIESSSDRQLKHVEVQERCRLPDAEQIAQEKAEAAAAAATH